jgi:hypothetical protein
VGAIPLIFYYSEVLFMNALTPEIYNSLFEVNSDDTELFGISLDESAPRENISAKQWREYDELID